MNIEDLSVESIKTLSWDDIEKDYNLSKADVKVSLAKGKRSSDNFWVPYEDNMYEEPEVLVVKKLMLEKFPDIIIASEHDYKYMEFFISTLEKCQFKYSIIKSISKCKQAK